VSDPRTIRIVRGDRTVECLFVSTSVDTEKPYDCTVSYPLAGHLTFDLRTFTPKKGRKRADPLAGWSIHVDDRERARELLAAALDEQRRKAAGPRAT
jgi:hypothetical protein